MELAEPTTFAQAGWRHYVPTRPKTTLAFSIVIPMKDEADNAETLLRDCVLAASPLGPFEICVVDDGSSDGTADILRRFQQQHPQVTLTILHHARSAGQSAALHTAILFSKAAVICTLDGDGQNPPDQIGKLIAPLLAAPDGQLALVAGQRVKRNDPVGKRVASRIANAIRSTLLRDGTRDTGCGHKAFRRSAYLALPYFNHMHRYLPALFQRDGWEITLVDVTHKDRVAGRSKYTNLGRAIVGISDLIGVAWLIRRRKSVRTTEISVYSHKRDSA